jgi:membrane fusion protein (multidrug efflux system)
MYANVTVEVGSPVRRLTLPQTAVAYNPYGTTVYVVVPRGKNGANGAPAPASAPKSTEATAARSAAAPDLVATQVFVTTGPTRGDQVAILKGINEGDEVVTSGQIKLRNGALVTINNSVQPSNDPNPKPQPH